jgi:hypothetical protein
MSNYLVIIYFPFGKICWIHSGIAKRALFCWSRPRYDVLVDTTFTLFPMRPHDIFKFKCTAWAIRSSSYVPFIPLRQFWEPTPSFAHRRHIVRFASLLSLRSASRTLAHVQKPGFVFRRNGRVHLNWLWRQFTRILAAELYFEQTHKLIIFQITDPILFQRSFNNYKSLNDPKYFYLPYKSPSLSE